MNRFLVVVSAWTMHVAVAQFFLVPFRAQTEAAAAGLDEIGYSLFVSTAQGKNGHFDQLVHRFLQRRVDALVCVHADGDGASLARYAAADVPVMALISKGGGVFPRSAKSVPVSPQMVAGMPCRWAAVAMSRNARRKGGESASKRPDTRSLARSAA